MYQRSLKCPAWACHTAFRSFILSTVLEDISSMRYVRCRKCIHIQEHILRTQFP